MEYVIKNDKGQYLVLTHDQYIRKWVDDDTDATVFDIRQEALEASEAFCLTFDDNTSVVPITVS